MSDFQGDVLLINELNSDGGDLQNIANGDNIIIDDTSGFETMVYLCLFGGNYEDDGTEATKKYTWWGNLTEPDNPERWLVSRTQKILRGMPAVPANIIKLKLAIKEDLQVFLDEKIADKIITEVSIPSKNRVTIEIQILKNKNLVYKNKYEQNWIVMAD